MKKLIVWMEGRTKNSFLLLLVVGGYLLYAVYEMYKGLPEVTGNVAVIYAAMALFVVAGVLLVAVAVFAMRGKHYREALPHSQEDDSAEAESK